MKRNYLDILLSCFPCKKIIAKDRQKVDTKIKLPCIGFARTNLKVDQGIDLVQGETCIFSALPNSQWILVNALQYLNIIDYDMFLIRTSSTKYVYKQQITRTLRKKSGNEIEPSIFSSFKRVALLDYKSNSQSHR